MAAEAQISAKHIELNWEREMRRRKKERKKEEIDYMCVLVWLWGDRFMDKNQNG